MTAQLFCKLVGDIIMKNILFIFAHPDDAEIYAGGLMLKLYHKDINFRICCVLNEQKDKQLNKIRKNELEMSLNNVGIKPDYLDILDGKLIWDEIEINKLYKYIEDNDPFLIITHNIHDYHNDHRHVSDIVNSIASYRWPVIMSDTLCGNNHEPQYYCDITKYMHMKINMILCHTSQVKSCNYSEMARILNSFRGLQYTGKADYYCEAYSSYSGYHRNDLEKRLRNLFED